MASEILPAHDQPHSLYSLVFMVRGGGGGVFSHGIVLCMGLNFHSPPLSMPTYRQLDLGMQYN